jgi:putative flippase GtrA
MACSIGRDRPMADPISPWRHYGGFLLAGVCALVTDAAILQALTKIAGLGPLIARPAGIACALVVSWWINRTVAFAIETPPTWVEFGKFAAASAAAFTVNYLVFAAILLTYPAVHPVLAIIFASIISMFVSYAGYRLGVFPSPKSSS